MELSNENGQLCKQRLVHGRAVRELLKCGMRRLQRVMSLHGWATSFHLTRAKRALERMCMDALAVFRPVSFRDVHHG